MLANTPSNARILTPHCQLADALNCDLHNPPAGGCPFPPDGATFTMTVSGLDSGQELFFDYKLTDADGNDAGQSTARASTNGSVSLPPLIQGWGFEFTEHFVQSPSHLDEKICRASPSSGIADQPSITVDVTCNVVDFPQDQTKFEPFLPLWPVFADPWPWYLSSFGPFTSGDPTFCQRQTVCTESPQEVTTDGGDVIVTEVLTCTDQCTAGATIVLHGPSTKIEFPDGDHAGTGTLTVDGYAVDAQGVDELKFYVDEQPVTLSGLQTNRSRPDACTEVQGANRTNCSTTRGFTGTLDATTLSSGTHKLRVVALDAKTGYPMATLAEKAFTVPSCFDSTRPTVSLTSPANGSTVSGTVTLSASASDNVGVTRVALFVDGVRVANDFTAPYTYTWNTETVANGSHTLMARAFDACGNWRGTQSTVTVNNIVPCQENSTTLCFQNNRFSARVAISGQNGVAIPFTQTGGFFRLSDPANVEVAVKVLDGRSTNGRFWVFHGSLTTQPYTVTVTDTHTGRVKTYNNSGLCGGADTSSFVDSALWYDLAISSGTCSPTSWSACLEGDRFRVEVLQGGDPQRAVEITSKTASFGFTSASDPEVVVKVLDGRAVNNRYWVFFGSLTNQSYTVRVTDTVTGIAKLYGAPGAFCGNADTSAF